jgi:hypothetical protein
VLALSGEQGRFNAVDSAEMSWLQADLAKVDGIFRVDFSPLVFRNTTLGGRLDATHCLMLSTTTCRRLRSLWMTTSYYLPHAD